MSIETVDKIIAEAFGGMHGWMSEHKARRVARLVCVAALSSPEPLCVELGVFGGRGVAAMGLAIKHCLEGRGRVDGIDPYTAAASLEGLNDPTNDQWWSRVDYPAILSHAQMCLSKYGLADIVHLITRRSQDAVVEYADRSVDVLHQDSNHSAAVSMAEVELWAPKMKPSSFWVQDDCNWPTTLPAQKMLIDRGYAVIEDHTEWKIYRAPG